MDPELLFILKVALLVMVLVAVLTLIEWSMDRGRNVKRHGNEKPIFYAKKMVGIVATLVGAAAISYAYGGIWGLVACVVVQAIIVIGGGYATRRR